MSSGPEIWCGLPPAQLVGEPDVIVFPEGIAFRHVSEAARRRPDAVVAGAFPDGGRMRGALWHRGRNQIDYLKVGSDGHTAGGELPKVPPVYATGSVAVGLLICMDVDEPRLSNSVVDALNSSGATFKVLCVPAEMQLGLRFAGELLTPPGWNGIHLALSNGVDRYPDCRTPSFISDSHGARAVVQVGRDPVRLRLNRS